MAITKLAHELLSYFENSEKTDFVDEDCYEVEGITKTNLNGIIDELIEHGKVKIDESSIYRKIILK